VLTGFIIPIDGACLSEFQGHLPSSPREYRNGTHEGFDFYGFASCRTIDTGTAVLAAKDGTVVRIDQIYREITLAQFEEATDPSVATLNPDLREQFLDRLRGRQVWIDHGTGVVTRYAHLSAVAAGLQVGDAVRAGRVVGFVGESGQLESITAPGTDWHLHFEIRIAETYLGEGLVPPLARALYVESFGFGAGSVRQ
jgi:murein DD-endopeptidase MepM/ murein hydrolase activator NlpD